MYSVNMRQILKDKLDHRNTKKPHRLGCGMGLSGHPLGCSFRFRFPGLDLSLIVCALLNIDVLEERDFCSVRENRFTGDSLGPLFSVGDLNDLVATFFGQQKVPDIKNQISVGKFPLRVLQ